MLPRNKHRIYEIIPGATVWATFLIGIALSFIQPLWVIYFIIVYDLFWLFRVINFLIHLFISWQKYRVAIKRDWMEDLKKLPNWEKLCHLVFLPTYKEDIGVIETTFENLVKTHYPLKKMFIVLAGEERDKENFLQIADNIKRKYGHFFKRFVITLHPAEKADELAGKGSNIHYAGHKAKELIDELRIPYEDIIVSTFDVDTITHRHYFACLAYNYLTVPNPTRTAYQPIALYGNNIWNVSAPVRVAAFGTTFWLMMELARPERLVTFSSHSMSFKALVDVGFWHKDIVSEDSRIFFQGLLHYHGDYNVVPIHLPVSMDTVTGKNYWENLKALYKQQRRWAWGVEHFPYLVSNFLGDKLTPVKKRLLYLWRAWEGMFTWATAPILIFVLGRLPLYVMGEQAKQEVISQAAPYTLEWIMALSMIGIFASAVVSLLLLPRRPRKKRRLNWLVMLFQWALLPITFVLFGSFPAIDAQTRLMTGRYLGFNVTEKKRE
ncbi:MAG: glycosyltransferase family 2 protein [Patescibacteria group bacterium]|nr:glycosyltransferase family 2 protein [Patescibacteria group bacterium]